jgi:hypothetical protein
MAIYDVLPRRRAVQMSSAPSTLLVGMPISQLFTSLRSDTHSKVPVGRDGPPAVPVGCADTKTRRAVPFGLSAIRRKKSRSVQTFEIPPYGAARSFPEPSTTLRGSASFPGARHNPCGVCGLEPTPRVTTRRNTLQDDSAVLRIISQGPIRVCGFSN